VITNLINKKGGGNEKKRSTKLVIKNYKIV